MARFSGFDLCTHRPASASARPNYAPYMPTVMTKQILPCVNACKQYCVKVQQVQWKDHCEIGLVPW